MSSMFQLSRFHEISFNIIKAGVGGGVHVTGEQPGMSSMFEVIHLGTEFHNKGTVLGGLSITLDVWP